jgi:holo-[acyl-carrier protein] synthase
MIIGLGEDLVEIKRIQKLIERRGDQFLSKCFTASEHAAADALPTENRKIAFYAKRYAAKEACLKALGTGMREGLSWQDMETGNDELGRPVLKVSGGVSDRLKIITPANQTAAIHITLSDEAGLAKATVILEAI